MSLDRLGDNRYHKMSSHLSRELAQKWINLCDSDMPETFKIVTETLDTNEFVESDRELLIRMIKSNQ